MLSFTYFFRLVRKRRKTNLSNLDRRHCPGRPRGRSGQPWTGCPASAPQLPGKSYSQHSAMPQPPSARLTYILFPVQARFFVVCEGLSWDSPRSLQGDLLMEGPWLRVLLHTNLLLLHPQPCFLSPSPRKVKRLLFTILGILPIPHGRMRQRSHMYTGKIGLEINPMHGNLVECTQGFQSIISQNLEIPEENKITSNMQEIFTILLLILE